MKKVVAGLVLGNYVDTKRIYTPNDIVSDMMREHGISLDYHQAWRAKIKAVKILRGDPTKSYQKHKIRIPGRFKLKENLETVHHMSPNYDLYPGLRLMVSYLYSDLTYATKSKIKLRNQMIHYN